MLEFSGNIKPNDGLRLARILDNRMLVDSVFL